ncbi:MAG TPA: ester cyclase [Ramlibacter sp.]|nr:ester cyclase [Ramlibacter sp.]
MITEELRRKRAQIVRRHMEVENTGDAEALLATFHRPRYDLVSASAIREGADQVRQHVLDLRAALPGCLVEGVAFHYADDAVIVETRTRGPHTGGWNGIPASGRPIDIRGIAMFVFDADKLMEERVYYDRQTLRDQITPTP